MPSLRYPLGTLRGIPVEAHLSLLVIVGVLALRQEHPGAVVVVFALLVGAVFLHEVAHAAAALWRGYAPQRLALHACGGLRHLDAPPSTAADDLLVTLAGPAASLAVGAAVVALATLVPVGWAGTALRDAGILSLQWGAFNLLPAFPMDGGRVLRLLVSRRGDPVRGTLTALRISEVILSLLGLYGLLARSPACVVLAVYLYFRGKADGPAALAEVRQRSDSATVSPPPYAKSRPQRVDVTRVDL